MENGVQALKLGASMLIFVIAITITISVFTNAAQALNRIFEMQNADEEYVTDENGNYLNYVNFEGGTRIVGIETIVPSIYRAYAENYCIYFYNADGSEFDLLPDDESVDINWIGQVDDRKLEENIEERNGDYSAQQFFEEKNLYELLEGKKFVEMLGEYYPSDLGSGSEAPEANKIKKRSIAYIVYEEGSE